MCSLPLHDWLILFTGNKCDLESRREVQFAEACSLAKDKDLLVALETSAKEADNVDEAFIMMARQLLARNGLAVKVDNRKMDSQHSLLRSNSRPINSPIQTSERKPCECWHRTRFEKQRYTIYRCCTFKTSWCFTTDMDSGGFSVSNQFISQSSSKHKAFFSGTPTKNCKCRHLHVE